MVAAGELIDGYHGFARITMTRFGTYPKITHPQNSSSLSFRKTLLSYLL